MADMKGVLIYVGLACMIVVAVALSLLASVELMEKPAAKTGTDYVTLTIANNPVNGLDQYFPANFTVESGVPVVITIVNYDTGANPVPGLPANTSHTFTIASLGLNVPVPAAPADNQPSVTTFDFTFQPGHYTWVCLAPCDPIAMETPGYMIGSVTAV